MHMPLGHGHVAQLDVEVKGEGGEVAVADELAPHLGALKRRVEARSADLVGAQPEIEESACVQLQVIVLHNSEGAGNR